MQFIKYQNFTFCCLSCIYLNEETVIFPKLEGPGSLNQNFKKKSLNFTIIINIFIKVKYIRYFY